MRRFLVIILLFSFNGCVAEETPLPEKEQLLSLHESFYDHLHVTEEHVSIYASARMKELGLPECRIYRDEISLFLDLVRYGDPARVLGIYRKKGKRRFDRETRDLIHRWKEETLLRSVKSGRGPLDGIRIALDPGHIAGNYEEAIGERKYVWLNTPEERLQIFEAELNLLTARLLKRMLEKDGARVFMTRYGPGPVSGESFEHWVRYSMYRDLRRMVREGDIDRHTSWYIRARAGEEARYRFFLKEIDRPRRAELINDFSPHLTISMHYNATPAPASHYRKKIVRIRSIINKEVEPGQKVEKIEDVVMETFSTNDDYHIVFIPGAFMRGELSEPRSRLALLRLVLSDDMERSRKLAGEVSRLFERRLDVPPVPESYEQFGHSISAGIPGVFARNLRMTRLVSGPVILGEPLLQNNAREARMLAKRDISYHGMRINRRILEVARCYHRAIRNYVRKYPPDERR
jgi:N-acetylmuramoyl-L-alanine amidase